ncbi:MAG TPA: endonuclease NucS domain-containing protein [Pirellulales bacterium]|nr:endonuclease NucS domain-containing protein [Pirellulales bacterium]
MEDQEPKVFPLLRAYDFAEQHGMSQDAEDIREMEIEWDRSYDSSVRRGRMIELFEKRGLLPQFIDEKWPLGRSPQGESKIRQSTKIWRDYVAYLSGNASSNSEKQEEEQDALEFALEAHLRDFLAKNLDRVEAGLQLYVNGDESGREFNVDDGRIDLLAVDRDKKYVVIELKLSRGRNKTLGQLLYYMGWVDKHLGNGPCRGAIIANEITDDLRVAVSRVPGVFLARYKMSFSVDRVI